MSTPDAAFRAFLAGLLDNPMQRGQPFSALVLHLCKTHGLTRTYAIAGKCTGWYANNRKA